MKKLTLLLPALILIYGCAGNSTKKMDSVATTKASSIKPVVIKQPTTDTVVVGFDKFLRRFNGDSVYQKAHVKFPLKMEFPNEDGDTTKYLPATDWRNMRFVSKGENIFTKVKIDQTHYDIQYQIEDTGFFVNYYFAYRESEWWLESTRDEGD